MRINRKSIPSTKSKEIYGREQGNVGKFSLSKEESKREHNVFVGHGYGYCLK